MNEVVAIMAAVNMAVQNTVAVDRRLMVNRLTGRTVVPANITRCIVAVATTRCIVLAIIAPRDTVQVVWARHRVVLAPTGALRNSNASSTNCKTNFAN